MRQECIQTRKQLHDCHCRRTGCQAAASEGFPSASRPANNGGGINPFLRVVLPTALALLLCNMDRICLSVAIIPMSREFGWPESLQVGRSRGAAHLLPIACSHPIRQGNKCLSSCAGCHPSSVPLGLHGYTTDRRHTRGQAGREACDGCWHALVLPGQPPAASCVVTTSCSSGAHSASCAPGALLCGRWR
jgi:hypothetical protein